MQQAALDEARGRIRLSPVQLTVLGGVLQGEAAAEGEARQALRELRDAGFLDGDGRVHPLVAEFARAGAEPMIRMTVETSSSQGLAVGHVVIAGEGVWYSEPWPQDGPEDLVTYQRAELPTIVWDLGRMVGLHRGRPQPDAAAFRAPLGLVEGLTEAAAISPQDFEDARVVALARSRELWPEVPEGDRARCLAVVASLRASWRITVGWGEREEVRWLSVLDCGPEGYWRRVAPVEPLTRADESTVVELHPVSAGEVWTALGELLPSSRQLRRATEGVGAHVRP